MRYDTKFTRAIIWQNSEENGVGESAIAVEVWPSSDMISLNQEGRDVLINYDNIDELCKLLKELKAERQTNKTKAR